MYKMRPDGPCLAADPCGSLGGVWRRVQEGWWDLKQYGASFLSDAPDSSCHCLTAAFQAHGPNLLRTNCQKYWRTGFFNGRCILRFIPTSAVCPPSPCIKMDRLTRSHQRPYRCFLPAPALDAPDQRPISAPSQNSLPHIWSAPCQLRKVGSVLFRPCCLFHPDQGQTNLKEAKNCHSYFSWILFSAKCVGC